MFTLGFAIGIAFAFLTYRIGWYQGAKEEQRARLTRLKSIRELIGKQSIKDSVGN